MQIGKQTQSLHETLPTAKFGSSTRDKDSSRFLSSAHAAKTRKGTQGPDGDKMYAHQNPAQLTSFGKQQLANRNSSPSHRFSSGPQRVFKTSDTPGPGAYD